MQWHMVSTKFIIKIGHAHNHPIADSWPENYIVKIRKHTCAPYIREGCSLHNAEIGNKLGPQIRRFFPSKITLQLIKLKDVRITMTICKKFWHINVKF